MQQKSELPEGWVSTILSQVGNITTGNTPPKKDPSNFGDEYPWVKPGDLDQSTPIIKTDEHLSEKGASIARLLPINTVLVSCIGNLGKVGIAGRELATNQQINSVTFNNSIVYPKYGYYHCKVLRNWLEDNSSATTIQIINKTRFSEAPFLLPPFHEQHRIVAAIEALFARLDATNERLDRVPEIIKAFRQAVLAAACDGRLTEEWRRANPHVEDAALTVNTYQKAFDKKSNKKSKAENDEIEKQQLPPKWTAEYLENIISIAGRIGWKGLKAEEYTDEGPLFLSAHNLSSSKYVAFTNSNHISEERYLESPEIMLQEENILLVKDGSGIGKIGIVKNLPQEATVNSSLLVIHPCEVIIAGYLYYLLSGPEMQNLVRQRITGSATPHLFQKDIKKFILTIPPLPEQQEIVRRVDALFTFADSIEAKVVAAKKKTEQLRQSILTKAFSGELVPIEAELARQEGRDYESAEVLLERVKAERATSKKK